MLETQLKPEVEANRIIISDDGTPYEYHVEKFGAKTTIDYLPYILMFFGEGVGQLVESLFSDDDLDAAMAGKAIDTFARRMLEVNASSLMVRLLAKTSRKNRTVDGETYEFVRISEAVFNQAYAGNLGELFKALLFVVETNYAPFLRERLGDSETLTHRLRSVLERLSTQAARTSSGGGSSERATSASQ